jgi:hypothetical protein
MISLRRAPRISQRISPQEKELDMICETCNYQDMAHVLNVKFIEAPADRKRETIFNTCATRPGAFFILKGGAA